MGEFARAFGGGSEITILGETYKVETFGMRDWARFEQYVIRRKRKEHVQLVADVLESLPENMRQAEFDKALAGARQIDSISLGELQRFADTHEGVAYTVWVLIDNRYPGKVTFEQVFDDILRLTKDDITAYQDLLDARNQAATLGPEGNGTGLNPSGSTSSGISANDQNTSPTNSSPQPGVSSSES